MPETQDSDHRSEATAEPVIRPAAPRDAHAIHRLQVDCAAEDISYGYRPAGEAEIRAALGPYFVVADLHDRVIGFARAAVRVSAGMAVVPKGKEYLQLDDLYVATDHRSMGAGCKLIDFLLMTAKLAGIEYALACSAAKDVHGSLQFYQACGFRSWYIQLFKTL